DGQDPHQRVPRGRGPRSRGDPSYGSRVGRTLYQPRRRRATAARAVPRQRLGGADLRQRRRRHRQERGRGRLAVHGGRGAEEEVPGLEQEWNGRRARCGSVLGVANIMYVVVKERTQEIGIKRALGARRRHIMAQFLFEAMAIALSGGLVGLAVATLIVLGVDAIPTEGNEAMQYILNPKLSWPIALICVGILIGVGLLAGILPARRAAAVDPVESLRYE